MAALNASLGQQLGNPAAAAVVLFVVALACSSIVMLNSNIPAPSQFLSVPPYLLLGGAIVAFYVLGVTWGVPHVGVANAIVFVLLGQMFSAAVIDHFGLLGSVGEPISLKRAMGLSLILVGVLLAKKGM